MRTTAIASGSCMASGSLSATIRLTTATVSGAETSNQSPLTRARLPHDRVVRLCKDNFCQCRGRSRSTLGRTKPCFRQRIPARSARFRPKFSWEIVVSPSNQCNIGRISRHQSWCKSRWFPRNECSRSLTDVQSTCVAVSTSLVSPSRKDTFWPPCTVH